MNPLERFQSKDVRKLFEESNEIELFNGFVEKALSSVKNRNATEAKLELEVQEDMLVQKYPERAEEIVLIFRFCNQLREKIDLDIKQGQSGLKKQGVLNPNAESLTEQQYVISEFILKNSSHEIYFRNFWEQLRKIAEELNAIRVFEKIKSGVLGQVAAVKLFGLAGMKVELSNPNEDVHLGIDAWIEANEGRIPLQVKNHNGISQAFLVSYSNGKPQTTFLENQDSLLTSFDHEKVEADETLFAKWINKLRHLEGLSEIAEHAKLIALSSDAYDKWTGKPNPTFIEKARAILEQKISLDQAA